MKGLRQDRRFRQASLPLLAPVSHCRCWGTASGALRASYLVIWVVDSEVAHTDDDLVKQAFTGDLTAVAQEGAGDVPECKGQALRPCNRLAETRGSQNPWPR